MIEVSLHYTRTSDSYTVNLEDVLHRFNDTCMRFFYCKTFHSIFESKSNEQDVVKPSDDWGE